MPGSIRGPIRRSLQAIGAGKFPSGGVALWLAICFDDASFTNSRLLDGIPACRGVKLKINMVKGAVAPGALGSTTAAANVAEELRAEIANIAADGAMAASLDRWSSFSASETRSVLA